MRQAGVARRHGARAKNIEQGGGGGLGRKKKSLLLSADILPNAVRPRKGGNEALRLVNRASIKTINVNRLITNQFQSSDQISLFRFLLEGEAGAKRESREGMGREQII